jgi:hypothetical protein
MLPELTEEYQNHWLTQVTVMTAEYIKNEIQGVVLLISEFDDQRLGPDTP